MSINPRYYQVDAVDALFEYFEKNSGNPLIVMPTGTGKSVVIAMLLMKILYYYPNQKILVVTHKQELIEQDYEKLLGLWPYAPAGINSAGLNRRDTNNSIVFAGIASVYKDAADFGVVHLVFVDEAHLISNDEETMYRQFFNALMEKNSLLKAVGFTATPWRLGQGLLTQDTVAKDKTVQKSLFTDICYDNTKFEDFNRLIAEGFLVPVVPKKTNLKLNTDGVTISGGEFKESSLQKAVNKIEITIAGIQEVLEHSLHETRKRWIVFAAGIDHTISIADVLNSFGVKTTFVHSKLKDAERKQRILDYKQGKYQAIVNNNILTTGFDDPQIDLILCFRPTMSVILWVQMLGRGTRPHSEKENCLVYDFAGNTKRLGPINDPVIPKKKGEKQGEAPVKECPCCETWVHLSARYCTGEYVNGTKCKHEFEFQTKIQTTASTLDLIKAELPVVEVFPVTLITYAKYTKGLNSMLRVIYYVGLQQYSEFVFIESSGSAKNVMRWWLERINTNPPKTVDEVLDIAQNFKVPTHIRVWTNKKYPEIMGVCFDNSGFNIAESNPIVPQVIVNKPKTIESPYSFDEDIPF